MYWFIVIGILIILIVFAIIFIIKYHQLEYLKLKINKAEKNINNCCKKKYFILIRYMEFIKDKININYDEFNKYNDLDLNMPINELNVKINTFKKEITNYLDNNEKLLKEKELKRINLELDSENNLLNGSIKYYNDNIISYNNLIKSFPFNLVAKVLKYHEKDFIEKEEKENFKILEDE